MLNELVKFLGEDDYFITKDKDENIIEVREKTNDIVNQDIAFLLIEDGLKYNILRKSRGSEAKIITLSNKATALFYLGAKVKVSRLSTLYPKPKISHISSKDNAREILSDFLDDGLYEIEKRKKDAICLFEENNIYVVGYCDMDMVFHTISEDNPDLTIGTKVLVNFTWKYMHFKKMIEEYGIELNYTTQDYKEILYDLLNLKN
ncbi:hypothetical protein HB897_09505 [Listeria seeligeri]|uniref:Uncharacterized protein n=1 Tax=Listeria seeligeri TaxID=1640 RepID=A0A7X0X2L4_LISSE|nr:hypothetical protein [Listeria seeligeri]MBC1486462.1 hypothetical protein [Listeria seeligeri]MBM5696200.1 hypothetical protein [Listeria seeligeri]